MKSNRKAAPEAGPTVLKGQIKLQPVAALTPYVGNARKHSKDQIRRLSEAIQEFGFVSPILVDDTNIILAGHARLEAAKGLNMPEVPTLRVSHLSDAQRQAYVIADNRIAELAAWDKPVLIDELSKLLKLDFAVETIGFATPELDQLLYVVDEDEEVLEPDEDSPTVARAGDLFELGPHRLFCGDSTLESSYAAVLGEERARTVFTDPPYNVSIKNHVTVEGKHREFAMASGEMSTTEFTAFLDKACALMTAFSLDGSLHFICMDWRHMKELMNASEPHYSELKNLIVWNKEKGGMGSFYRSKHELVFLFKRGSASHINNVELGKHGRYRTNVWNYPGANSTGKSRQKRLAMHPTVKPVSMIADAILDSSNRGDWVLDSFGGSGSTLLATHSVGRRAALIELDPKFVDVIIRRFEERTGLQAVHVASSMSFKELTHARTKQGIKDGQG